MNLIINLLIVYLFSLTNNISTTFVSSNFMFGKNNIPSLLLKLKINFSVFIVKKKFS